MPPPPASRRTARLMLAPALGMLAGWMLVPLAMTLWFSLQRYTLITSGAQGFAGLENYRYFITDPAFAPSLGNTLALVLGVLALTLPGGLGIALVLAQPFWGRGVVRALVLAPFFIMPSVSALVWKTMLLHPMSGLLAHLARSLGLQPFDFLSQAPLATLIALLAWQWVPFVALILLTALQSLDPAQIEAARLDGAGPAARLRHLILPHLGRAIAVAVLIQTIFLLSTFAEILVTTNGGPGTASTTLTYLVYIQSLLQFDPGTGAAGGILAVLLANAVAIFLMRLIGRALER
ncbi:carbohydrate ABC transporter permease [Rhodobacter maris]|uniref:Sorbitol ABC transporter membrane protein /mannitol ABC transporter membrane protein n=1 Tax=Rhodobacter maris TaxID=446682 RepID=A0A285RY15_9RHOB|nr:sugar ABC transporter permease [Rhodobacter maris]SOB99472.1 sorbitol ABC transporter membrane protein /mannitol ABC transporter membrane protein [Rhodobacter maris]